MARDHMHDFTLSLDIASDADHGGAEHRAAEGLEHLLPNHDIGDAGLVLDGHEHDALRRAWALAHQHEARNVNLASIACGDGLGAGQDTPARKAGTQEGKRMLAQRQPNMGCVGWP